MLKKHIKYLLKFDLDFQNHWKALSFKEQKEFIWLSRKIDQYKVNDYNIKTKSDYIRGITSRYMARVGEKDMLYSKLSPDWNEFLDDRKDQSHLFNFSKKIILEFLKKTDKKNIRFYGNIKPIDSLNRRKSIVYDNNPDKKQIYDVFDIVRFKIVTQDLNSLLDMAISIWETFQDIIVYCHNYYCIPKYNNPSNQYRAIHFFIEIKKQRLIELQVLTKACEIVALFDYNLNYKGIFEYMNIHHKKWLELFSIKANLYDSESISKYNPLIYNNITGLFTREI